MGLKGVEVWRSPQVRQGVFLGAEEPTPVLGPPDAAVTKLRPIFAG